MQHFEYKVVAAPRAAKKFKGVKGHPDRFARTIEEVIGEEAVNGWEYLRADTLPSDMKGGLMRKAAEVYQTLLIFRRVKPALAPKKPATIAEPIPEPKWEAPSLVAAADDDGDETPPPKRPSLGSATD